MLALDENRDFGSVGIGDGEPLPAQLTDMRDLVKRDRSHPSVMAWSFCNEGECHADGASAFRKTSCKMATLSRFGCSLCTTLLTASPFRRVRSYAHGHPKLLLRQ